MQEKMSRRKFLELGLGAVGAAAAGFLGVEALTKRGGEKDKKIDIYDSDKMEKEAIGQCIQPEKKEMPPYFVSDGEALKNEFSIVLDSLEPAERGLLEKEWERISRQEGEKMYCRRFGNSEKQIEKYFSKILKDENHRFTAGKLVVDACLENKIPPEVLLGVIGAESGGDPNARSKSKPSARGILQLVPITAREMGLTVEIDRHDKVVGVDERYDIEKNIKAGAAYLAKMKERFGSWGLASVAFCEGPTKLDRQLRQCKALEEHRNIVHLYSKYKLGKIHPFQYPFYVYAMGKQMLEIMNEGRILPFARERENKNLDDFKNKKTARVVKNI